MTAVSPAQKQDVPTVRMFATCTPGLGPVLARILSGLAGVHVIWQGHDGRADVVSFQAPPTQISHIKKVARAADDLFLQIGHTRRADGDRAGWLAQRLCRRQQLHTAVALSGKTVHTASYRVIARVLSERSFTRSELRRSTETVIGHLCPHWRWNDPAVHEVWIAEYRPGLFVAGLRLTGSEHRRRSGRAVQRQGALRPGIASAMVYLAGAPSGIMIDPCCGSGTILAEADEVGWTVRGFDIDAAAVAATQANLPGAQATQADARRLPLADNAVACWVSNLPFGHQFRMGGNPSRWLGQVMAEAARIIAPSGRIVVLSTGIPAHVLPPVLLREHYYQVRVLGFPAVVEAFRRR